MLGGLPGEHLFSPKKEQGITTEIWKDVSEQISRLLEQCPLDKLDQSGDVWPYCTVPCLEETKQHINLSNPRWWLFFIDTGPWHIAISLYTRIFWRQICPSVQQLKLSLNWDMEKGQRSWAHHQIYNRMVEQEKNQSVAMILSKSRWYKLVEMLCLNNVTFNNVICHVFYIWVWFT